MSTGIPIELQQKLARVLQHWDRGLVTEDETTNEIRYVILSQVEQEQARVPPADRDPRPGIARRAANARRETLLVAVSQSLEVPTGVLVWACRASLPGKDPTFDATILEHLSAIQTPEDLDDRENVELALAWLEGGGQPPARLVELTEDARPLSRLSWLNYLAARNVGDGDTQEKVIRADVVAGCPASLLFHLDGADASRDAVRAALDQINQPALQAQGRWGDLASVAIFITTRGWFEWAHEWSSAVLDEQVLPKNTYHRDQAQAHHAVQGWCDDNDARIFAPLALIDLLAGDEERAASRSERGRYHDGEELGTSGWGLAGHHALADWVTAHLEPQASVRRELLESIDHRHTWLGLLQAQINSDLAAIAQSDGEVAQAEALRASAQEALDDPQMTLHMGFFPHNTLLEQLPFPRSFTSRPAAWQVSHLPNPASGPVVAELQDLTYPQDVEEFIRSWFIHDPNRADSLTAHIASRPELRSGAVVPLLLTFYCLLAGDSPDTQVNLPARRWQLYRDLIRMLLMRDWRPSAPGLDAAPDPQTCEVILRDWAWKAVKDANTPAGLGAWGDVFTQPADDVPPAVAAAIDHVAPMQARDRQGRLTRRFVHRTLLEHFVAEYIADLPAPQAAAVLLPHLWFDPDWEVAAPAAIAAHNRNQPGELVDRLLRDALSAGSDQGRQVADQEVQRLFLAVAEESDPGEWTENHQQFIHDCRRSRALDNPRALAAVAHWPASNPDIRAAILAALPTARPGDVTDLVDALTALQPTQAERGQALAAILAALPTARPGDVTDLVDALTALQPTQAERGQALAAILAALPTARPGDVTVLVDALTALQPTQAERGQALAAILAALPTAHPGDVTVLVDALTALQPTQAERGQALAAILAALPTADPGDVTALVDALTALQPTQAERGQARAVILAALPTAHPLVATRLVEALTALQPTGVERGQARAAILAALPTADPGDVTDLLAALTALQPTGVERGQARDAILAALSTAHPGDVTDLLAALTALQPTEAERGQARAAILAALLTTRPFDVTRLVGALTALQPTEAERGQARAAILAALLTADQFAVRALVGALTALQPTEAERGQARGAVLAALPTAHPLVVTVLVDALTALQPTEAERGQALAAILAALPDVDLDDVAALVDALTALVVTEVERGQARAAILAALLTADPGVATRLVDALTALQPTGVERGQARDAILAALPTADPGDVTDLLAALTALQPTGVERGQARDAILAALSTAHPGDVTDLLAALTALQPTGVERGQARGAVLAALSTAHPGDVTRLVGALTALQPTEAERGQALAAILAALPTAHPFDVMHLVGALTALVVTEAERGQARGAVLAALPTAHPLVVTRLVAALTTLQPTEAERGQARGAVLAALPTAHPLLVTRLLAALTALQPTEAERGQARAAILAALPTADLYGLPLLLVAALRRFSRSDWWLAWLHNQDCDWP